MNKPELLAPCGSLEKLFWAFLYGADAVYIGGVNYSLRANAKNFTLDEIKKAVKITHDLNKKIYVTVNIVFKNSDVDNLEKYLIKLDEIGVDAIIFSDPIVLYFANKNNLKPELHLSTQASVLNKDAALYYKNHNVKRIVLARECKKEDIKDIINSVNVDIECFIHGAMCSNISGRCVLSNYFTNRDANKGGCAQVCRFNFNLYDERKNMISSSDNFTLASCDLSLMNYIDDMMKIGVSSFKLEGRMRSIYYIATIVSVYRKIIDMCYLKKIDKNYLKKAYIILNRCANRKTMPQFYHKPISYKEQYYNKRQEDSNQDFLGVVLDYDEKNKLIIIEQRNYFKKGDSVNIFDPTGNDFSFMIDEIFDENNELIEIVRHPRQIVKVKCEKKVIKNSLMRVNFLD